MSTTTTLPRPGARMRHGGKLSVLSGPDQGKRFTFEGRVRIGARDFAEIVLRDSGVSGLHCEIVAGDELRVRDLGSKNGTYLGGVRVIEAALTPGAVLTLGSTRLQVAPTHDVVEVGPVAGKETLHGLVARSTAMQALIARIEAVAPTQATVLVMGETGSGKELVAEAIHLASPRAQAPLVTVDCGAISATLIEAELFGYERGAFTGAERRFAGVFERADGGTLFLDEIGELPPPLQSRLLRALESRKVRRLGGQRDLSVDVRVVAATNRDLPLEVNAGRFREDLYHRLAVVTLTMPPLRERVEDLPLLVVQLLDKIGVDATPFLTAEGLQALIEHSWPGNVRELRNTLERAASLGQPALPEAAIVSQGAEVKIDLGLSYSLGKKRLLETYERVYLAHMLEQCRGNVTEVARRSGLERMSVYRIMRRLGLREMPGG